MQSESDRKALTRPPFVRVSERCSVCVRRRYIFKVGARVLCCCVSIMSLKGASMKKKIDKSIIGNTAAHYLMCHSNLTWGKIVSGGSLQLLSIDSKCFGSSWFRTSENWAKEKSPSPHLRLMMRSSRCSNAAAWLYLRTTLISSSTQRKEENLISRHD